MVVVVVFPFAEFVVEDLGVVDKDAVEEAVELFGVDAVGAFDAPMFDKPRVDERCRGVSRFVDAEDWRRSLGRCSA
jgi:hypothetical protein